MTARQIFSESTLVPVSLVVILIALSGWITRIDVKAEEGAKAADALESIDRRLSKMEGLIEVLVTKEGKHHGRN